MSKQFKVVDLNDQRAKTKAKTETDWNLCLICQEVKAGGHGGAVASAAASQLEGPGFDSRRGRCGCWRRVPSSMSSAPIPQVGLTKGPSCVEFACSPRVP